MSILSPSTIALTRFLSIALLCMAGFQAVAGSALGCLGASITAEEGGSPAIVAEARPAVVEVDRMVNRSLSVLGLEKNDLRVQVVEGKRSPKLQFTCDGPLEMTLVFPVAVADALLQRRNREGLLYVIGHELGHAITLKASPQTRARLCEGSASIRQVELLADFLSGFLAFQLRDPAESSSPDLRQRGAVVPTIASLADYEFSNPLHHGRIAERTAAFGFGANSAAFGHQLDVGYLAGHLDHFESLMFVPLLGQDPGLIDFRATLEKLYP